MLISHKKSFIYTKTYKTASTSIELLFEPYCVPKGKELSHRRKEQETESGIVGCRGYDPKQATWYNHMPADEIRKRIGDDTWRTYYKFCSVRNPFDKVVSKYNSVRSSRQGFIAGTLRGQIASLSRATLQLDFERFVHTVKSDRDKYVIDGEFCLDGVIFFEHIHEDTDRIIRTLGLNTDSSELPQLKSGRRLNSYDTHRYYNRRSKKYVEDEFELELQMFGYEFPEPRVTSKPSASSREEFTALV